MLPVVSVIMPAFNDGAFIAEAISSVLSQTFRDLELVIVDDGSNDNTRSVIEKFMMSDGRVRYFFQKNGGQGKARNLGINNSQGEFIAFIDSDDVWVSSKIEKQLSLLGKDDDFGLVYCDAEYIGENSNFLFLSSTVNKPFRGRVVKKLLVNNFITNSSVVIRRDVLNKSGLFNESSFFRSIEDYDLWLRISVRYTFDFVDENLVRYRYVQKINSPRSLAKSYQKISILYFGILLDRRFINSCFFVLFRAVAFFGASMWFYLRVLLANKRDNLGVL